MEKDTSLWWAGKELYRGKLLSDFIGKNEKTKIVKKPFLFKKKLIFVHVKKKKNFLNFWILGGFAFFGCFLIFFKKQKFLDLFFFFQKKEEKLLDI